MLLRPSPNAAWVLLLGEAEKVSTGTADYDRSVAENTLSAPGLFRYMGQN
jgi:hypothetical protein